MTSTVLVRECFFIAMTVLKREEVAAGRIKLHNGVLHNLNTSNIVCIFKIKKYIVRGPCSTHWSYEKIIRKFCQKNLKKEPPGRLK